MTKPTRESATQKLFEIGTARVQQPKNPKMSSKKIEAELKANTGTITDIHWLRNYMDEAIERGQPLWREPVENFRGSGSGDPCPRSIAFGVLGHNVPKDARVLRIFRVGNLVEQKIVEAAKKANLFVKGSDQLEGKIWDEVAPPSYNPIVSHVDMIANHPTLKGDYLIEIKSMNTNGFRRLPKEHLPTLAGETPLFDSYEGYVTQWNTYAYSPEINLKEGCLLFEDKNDQTQKYFWLLRDKKLLEATKAKHAYVSDFAFGEEKSIPPTPEDFDPTDSRGPCRRCDHRYLCKKVSQGEVNYDALREADAKLRG